MISYEDALAWVKERIPKVEAVKIPILQAKGCVLFENVSTSRPIPPFDRVAMDGIAVKIPKGSDPWRFRSEGKQFAGKPRRALRDPTCCMEVATGAPLPRGAQAVVRQEDLISEEEMWRVKPGALLRPYQNVHRKGEDALPQTLLLERGIRLTPAHIALLAALGKREVWVQKPLKVCVLSTGDELISAKERPRRFQIFSSNAEAICAAIGTSAMRLHAGDSLQEVEEAVQRGLHHAEMMTLSGGVSQGEKDFVPKALRSAGAEILIHGVAQKPGKPFLFAISKKGQPIFGLPGNPVACLICLYLYVLSPLGFCREEELAARGMAESVGKVSPGYAHFFLTAVQGNRASLVPSNGSGDLVALSRSDGFILLGKGIEGERVKLWKW